MISITKRNVTSETRREDEEEAFDTTRFHKCVGRAGVAQEGDKAWGRVDMELCNPWLMLIVATRRRRCTINMVFHI